MAGKGFSYFQRRSIQLRNDNINIFIAVKMHSYEKSYPSSNSSFLSIRGTLCNRKSLHVCTADQKWGKRETNETSIGARLQQLMDDRGLLRISLKRGFVAQQGFWTAGVLGVNITRALKVSTCKTNMAARYDRTIVL